MYGFNSISPDFYHNTTTSFSLNEFKGFFDRCSFHKIPIIPRIKLPLLKLTRISHAGDNSWEKSLLQFKRQGV